PPQLIEERTLLDFEAAPADGWRGEVVGVEGGKAGRFLVDRSDGPVAASFDYGTLGVEIDEWDELLFDYRFDRPGMAWWGIKIIDPPLGDSRQAVWQISDATKLEPAKWHTAVVDLRHPQDVWGDRASPNAHTLIFRAVLEASAQPVTVLIDNIRVRRSLLKVEKIAEGQRRTVDGVFCQSCKLLVTNHSQKPVVVTFSVAAKSTGASLARLPDKLSLGPGEEATVEPEIRVAREAATRLGRYQAEIVATEAASGAKVADVVMTVSTPLGELPHPVLLLRRDEVDEVLKAAQTAEGLKAALDGVIRSAETWLTKPLDFPNRGSQWWHWYTCKKCGSGLRTESPTRHVCPNCGAVYSGWPYDDVVLARQHGALADGARDLGLAYILTGREQYARRAAEILLGYAQRYESYPLHDINGRPTGGGRVGPQTLDEATWLIPIAQAFDAVQDRLTPEERKQIVEHLLIPAAKVTWAPRLPIHNISCWRNSAYALVGMALDDEEMVDAAVNGPGGYREQIEKGVIEPGLWYEGSWGYHFYTMSALLPFVEAAVRAGIDVLHEKYRGLYEAPVKFVAPDLRLPAFNDSGYVDLSRQAQMYQVAARHWPDSPDIAWAASLQPLRGWMALIWGARATKKPSVRFTSRVEKEAGYMV
ncbi:MAG: alginate lyase family protein, partial [Armatimonadetes bacterium]|nr:alginate lyase family protein [Armatimonadota bacterium]